MAAICKGLAGIVLHQPEASQEQGHRIIYFLKTSPVSKELSLGKAKISEFPENTLPFSSMPWKAWQDKWGNVPTPMA